MSAVDALKRTLATLPDGARLSLFVPVALFADPESWSALERVVDPTRWFESDFWASRGFKLETSQDFLRARDLALAPRGPTLWDWLDDPMRSTNEVKRALVRAIQQARMGEHNG